MNAMQHFNRVEMRLLMIQYITGKTVFFWMPTSPSLENTLEKVEKEKKGLRRENGHTNGTKKYYSVQ